MTNNGNKIINSEKECSVDVYANGISITFNPVECMITFHRDTPSLDNDGPIIRENVARVRIHPELAKQLGELITQASKGQKVNDNH